MIGTIAASVLLQSTAPAVSRVRTLQGVRIVSAAGGASGNLVALGLENTQVRIVDAATGQTRHTLQGHPQPCYGLAFSKDNRLLATGDDTGRIWIWDVRTGKKVREFPRIKGHKRGIQGLSFSFDGTRLLSVGKDDVMLVWRTSGGDPAATILGSGANFFGGHYLRNGSIITGTLKEGARLYRGTTLAATMTLPGGQGANDLAVNRAGTVAITAGRDGSATVWSLGNRQRTSAIKAHDDWVIYNALSPNGQILATSSNDRTVKFWNIKSGRRVAQIDDMSSVGAPMAFAGSGRFFVAADSSDQATIFSISPGQ